MRDLDQLGPIPFHSKHLWIKSTNLFLISLGLTALAQALDSKQAHTSFGKLPLSVERTNPAYQCPKAKRDDGEKLFMGELTKTDNAGKMSPGPIYNY